MPPNATKPPTSGSLRAMSQPSRVLALVALAALLSPPLAEAQVGLRLLRLTERGARVDGSLSDWRDARFQRLGSGDGSGRYVLGFNDDGIYLGATVTDNRLIHFREPSRTEDGVVLALALPGRRNALTLHEFYLQPGQSGRSAARALRADGRRLRPVSGARVVEDTSSSGRYTIEAFIPFSAIPGSARWQEGRGSVRIVDVDSEARPEIVHDHASAPVDPRHLDRLPPLLPEGGERDVFAQFEQRAGLTNATPRFQLRGQLAGDETAEQVAVVDRYLVIYGAGYRDGTGFDYLQLPVTSPNDVREANLRDLDGDGKREIVLRVRQSNRQGARELWMIYASDGSSIAAAGAIELTKETSAGRIVNELEFRRGRGRGRRRRPPSIRVELARSTMPRGSYRESPATDAEPILLPWGPTRARVFEWRDGRLRVSSVEPNPDHETGPVATAGSSAMASSAMAAPPRPPGIDDLVRALRRERNVPRNVRARFEQDANVAQGREDERVMILGEAIVVVGTAYLGGRSYFHYRLPVRSADDIVSLRTENVGGDRHEEILITVRQHHEGGIVRTLLLVHQLTDEGFPRLLSAEVGRSQGNNSVEVEVQARRGTLTLAPGRARGFDASNWPWAPSDGSDGVAPILLPWRDRAVRYRFRGGRLEAR